MENIFVVGLDAFHLAQLQTLPGAAGYAFHPLFTHAELKQTERFPVARLLEEGPCILKAFPGHVDAVIGYWDFPVSTALPLLRAAVGLPGPSLEAVLKCEHKYWSRLLQREAVPAHVPAFCLVDPFAADPIEQVNLDFPFWLKPVKSVLSHLGFRIDDAAGFAGAIERIRASIRRYAEPFDLILAGADLPPQIAAADGTHCIAEAIISAGSQCTQEGYAYRGEVKVYGTVDSLRFGPMLSSFSRYQYPSGLPQAVRERMTDITRRVIRHLGYDCAPFNIEYFWDAVQDRIWLLEINTRISKSHAPLFHMVDGAHHHQVMVELGLGRRPQFVQGRGAYGLAAKFMVRAYADALVVQVPTAAQIAALEAEVPGTRIRVAVREGMQLCDLRDQDSYSFEMAAIFVGANSQGELEAKFHKCMEQLPLRLQTVGPTG
jgi:hypothetical protein